VAGQLGDLVVQGADSDLPRPFEFEPPTVAAQVRASTLEYELLEFPGGPDHDDLGRHVVW
jgi:hypothetical protein